MEPQQEARALVERWMQAFAAADLEALLELYAQDATFIGTSSAGFTSAAEDVRAYFVRALRERTPLRADALQVVVQVLAGACVVTALDRIEWSDDASPRVSMGRVTFVLRRDPGSWRIVSFHRSEVPSR